MNRKISILLPDLRGGGAERVSLDLAHEFARLGHTVEFVLMQTTGELLPEALFNYAVVDLATPRARNVAPALARYLRQRRPDALIAAMWPLTVIAPLTARMAGFRGKVLVTEHAMLSQQYAARGWLHRLALRASAFAGYRLGSARVGVSHGTCADMAFLSGIAPDRFVTIHNPVRPATRAADHDLNGPNALWETDDPRILTVGNLKPVKNHPLLLRAFAAMPRPKARLILLGQGANEAALRALASDLGIADRVVFAGFQTDPSPFYATADLFVLSSDHEGFGNVIVEALSCGLPVVSTDCPSGPAEILQGGRFGRLVPVGDAPALARAMEDALVAPVDREALIRRAADFAPEIAARKYLELLGLT
ncbi:glycosyltransferase [Ancylobacter aquaticus]|nr:glycosyltransferase [Ancylobacter aquaticus]